MGLMELQEKYTLYLQQYRDLEHEYLDKPKGSVYQKKISQLRQKLDRLKVNLSQLGKEAEIVVKVRVAVKGDDPNQFYIGYYAGISRDDAELLVKALYPEFVYIHTEELDLGVLIDKDGKKLKPKVL